MKRRDTWGAWEEFEAPREDAGSRLYRNLRYQVLVRFIGKGTPFPGTGEGIRGFWLSIKRIDMREIHDWRDLQRIKNELVGEEAEAVELYPAESRLVDTSNQYHLFAFEGWRFPFGYVDRVVSTPEVSRTVGAAQRPWEPGQEPADANRDPEELRAALAERRASRHVPQPIESFHKPGDPPGTKGE